VLGNVPHDFSGGERRGEALQLDRSDGPELVAAAGAREQPDDVADEDLAAWGVVAEPAGLDDRCAEAVVALPHHVAGAEPDADGDRSRGAAAEPVDAALHRFGRSHGLDRGVEDDHEPVAGALDLVARVGGDGVPKHVLVFAPESVRRVVADGPTQRGR
jgi:hypothetical protein